MSHQTLLVTLSGLDRPGVTRQLFTSLHDYPVTVDDIEQFVVRGRLVLSVLLSIKDADDDQLLADLRKAVRRVAAVLDMDVATVTGAREDSAHRRDRITVTVLGIIFLGDWLRDVLDPKLR